MNLQDMLKEEINRCKHLLQKKFVEPGYEHWFGAVSLRRSLHKAEVAATTEDMIDMVVSLKDLEGYQP